MVVSISKLLKPEWIVLDLKSEDRLEAIREVAAALQGDSDMLHFDIFVDELLSRERVEPTCLGNEVAVPHARTDEVKRMMLAIGRSQRGVSFGGSNQLVRLIFVVATPRKMVTEYLTLIGIIARLLKNESLRTSLLEAPNPESFIARIAEAEKAF